MITVMCYFVSDNALSWSFQNFKLCIHFILFIQCRGLQRIPAATGREAAGWAARLSQTFKLILHTFPLSLYLAIPHIDASLLTHCDNFLDLLLYCQESCGTDLVNKLIDARNNSSPYRPRQNSYIHVWHTGATSALHMHRGKGRRLDCY